MNLNDLHRFVGKEVCVCVTPLTQLFDGGAQYLVTLLVVLEKALGKADQVIDVLGVVAEQAVHGLHAVRATLLELLVRLLDLLLGDVRTLQLLPLLAVVVEAATLRLFPMLLQI